MYETVKLSDPLRSNASHLGEPAPASRPFGYADNSSSELLAVQGAQMNSCASNLAGFLWFTVNNSHSYRRDENVSLLACYAKDKSHLDAY